MKNIKIFNIEFDGIDKSGKDSIRPYIWYLEPGKYLARSRGLLSQIAYSNLYERDFSYEDKGYTRNTLFVLVNVDKKDWEIRCKLTNEPKMDFTYEQSKEAFSNAITTLLNEYNVPLGQILVVNSSENTPYQIAKMICERIKELNYLEKKL